MNRFAVLMVALAPACILANAGCSAEKPPIPPAPPPLVRVAAAVATDALRTLRVSGSIEAASSTSVGFATLGTVTHVLVREGEAVKKGQVLARLSTSAYEDSLGMAQATADRAEDALRRLSPMAKNQTLPEVKLVEVETGAKQARLAVSMARRSLDDTVLRAPRDGVILRRQVDPGSNVAPGVPAFTLVETETLLATVPVPEKSVGRIREGDAAKVRVAALGRTLPGTIREIALAANPLTRTFSVKVAVENPGDLRIGMVADVHLEIAEETTGLAVPPEALRIDYAGVPFVYVVVPGDALALRRVEVLGYAGEGTVLGGGVAAGEFVVTSGTPMLGDGMKVRVAGSGSKITAGVAP